MDFSPAALFRSTKTGSRSSLDRVNKQISASRGTFRQKVHVGVLLATVALVTYGAIIIWSASQFKAASGAPACAAFPTFRRPCSSSISSWSSRLRFRACPTRAAWE